jgi:hypothetical protein
MLMTIDRWLSEDENWNLEVKMCQLSLSLSVSVSFTLSLTLSLTNHLNLISHYLIYHNQYHYMSISWSIIIIVLLWVTVAITHYSVLLLLLVLGNVRVWLWVAESKWLGESTVNFSRTGTDSDGVCIAYLYSQLVILLFLLLVIKVMTR